MRGSCESRKKVNQKTKMDSITVNDAKKIIENYTDELEKMRDTMTSHEFLCECDKYKQKVIDTYQRLSNIDWLIYKKINVCGMMFHLDEKNRIVKLMSPGTIDVEIDEKTLACMCNLIINFKRVGVDFETDDFSINIEKMPKLKRKYKFCFHTKTSKSA